MAFEVNLIERGPTGSVLKNIDLSNSTGTSAYRVKSPLRPGEPRYKKTKAGSPLSRYKRLTYSIRDTSETTILVSILGGTVDNMFAKLNDLDLFIDNCIDNQVLRNSGATSYNTYEFVIRAQNATTISHAGITDMSLKRPTSFYDSPILSATVEGFELWIEHTNFSASVYNLYTNAARTNGYNNGLLINASTAPVVNGDQAAPLRLRVAGGGTATTKLIAGLRYTDDPELFQHHLWAKDATLSGGTALSGTDASIEGNNTSIGTITTPVSTTETMTHRWVINTNVASQYGMFRAFGIGKRSAAVFSARMRLGLRDGSGNFVYPLGGGYTFPADELVSIGSHSGNDLALFNLGVLNVPSPYMGRVPIYGLVYELWVTCSSLAGTPTFTFDEVQLFPLLESSQQTGYVEAVYPAGLTEAGYFYIDAMDDVIEAYTLYFGATLQVGAPLLARPKTKAMLYMMLVDAANSRRNHTQTITATLDYHLQHGGGIGV